MKHVLMTLLWRLFEVLSDCDVAEPVLYSQSCKLCAVVVAACHHHDDADLWGVAGAMKVEMVLESAASEPFLLSCPHYLHEIKSWMGHGKWMHMPRSCIQQSWSECVLMESIDGLALRKTAARKGLSVRLGVCNCVQVAA